jgi:hypothetical protein
LKNEGYSSSEAASRRRTPLGSSSIIEPCETAKDAAFGLERIILAIDDLGCRELLA